MATKPKSTTQKLSAASQTEMKKNATVRPPTPTGNRATDKQAANQFVADSRKQTADRAAATKAATLQQQQLDYTRANPLQGTRPQTAAARTQVAQSRAPAVSQTAGQQANAKRIQAEAAARTAARPQSVPYTGPQGRDAQGRPIQVPGQAPAPVGKQMGPEFFPKGPGPIGGPAPAPPGMDTMPMPGMNPIENMPGGGGPTPEQLRGKMGGIRPGGPGGFRPGMSFEEMKQLTPPGQDPMSYFGLQGPMGGAPGNPGATGIYGTAKEMPISDPGPEQYAPPAPPVTNSPMPEGYGSTWEESLPRRNQLAQDYLTSNPYDTNMGGTQDLYNQYAFYNTNLNYGTPDQLKSPVQNWQEWLSQNQNPAPTPSPDMSGSIIAYPGRLNPQQQQQIQAQTDFFAQTLQPTYQQAVSGAQNMYNQSAPGVTNLNPQQQQIQAQTDFFTQTPPGATGIYGTAKEMPVQLPMNMADMYSQLDFNNPDLQAGKAYVNPQQQQFVDNQQAGIYGQSAPGLTPVMGASSGFIPGMSQQQFDQAFMPGNQPNNLGAANQPMQSYGQLLSGNTPNAGLNPQFNTNSSQPTGQLPGNAGNFGQQQQTTQQANPAQPSNSGKMGGSGGPMGPINTSAL